MRTCENCFHFSDIEGGKCLITLPFWVDTGQMGSERMLSNHLRDIDLEDYDNEIAQLCYAFKEYIPPEE